MAALRGPDSSEDERRLGEQAVFPETVDVNIRQLDPIPAPRAFLREQPLTDEMSELVLHVISAETKGNPDCHLVLRGSSHGPNYDAESVRQALEDLKVSKASGPSQHGLVIDAAHGNCGKDENREAEVIEEIAERLAHGEQGITGVMMESFLVGGHQKPAPLDQLVYGQSVTDACVPWERTNELLHTLADAVATRRAAK